MPDRFRRLRTRSVEFLTRLGVQEGDLRAAAVLALMPGIVFWRGLLHPALIAGEDAADFYQPYYTFAANEVQSGRFPLWNPYILLGVPFHASLQPSLFYPLRWPLFWMSYLQGYMLTLWTHYFLGGLATYLLLRAALRVGPLAALLGAMSVAFGGFFLGHMAHLPYVLAWPWFMLAILFSWLAVERGVWRWSLWAGLSIGLLCLIGAVQQLLILGVLLGTYVLYHAALDLGDLIRRRPGSTKRLLRPAAMIAAALALGITIGATQLLPASSMFVGSDREELGWSRITLGSAHPLKNALQLVVPFFFGNSRLGYWGEYNYPDMAHYTGVLMLLAAVVGAFCLRRERLPRFLLVLAAVGLLVGAGRFLPVYGWLYKLVPGFKQLRVPGRIFWCTDLAIAGLGALGVERGLIHPLRTEAKRRRIVAVTASGVLLLVLAGAVARLSVFARNPDLLAGSVKAWLVENHWMNMWAPYSLAAATAVPRRFIKELDPACWGNVLAALTAVGLFTALILRGRPLGRRAAGALVMILAVDLTALSLGMVPYARALDGSRMTAPTVGVPPEARWLKEHLGNQRYLVLPKSPRYPTADDQILPNRGMQFGLRFAGGKGGGIVDAPSRTQFLDQLESSPKLMSISGVRYLFVEGRKLDHPGFREVWQDVRYHVYENEDCLPMAYFVQKLVPAADPDQAVRILQSREHDPRSEAVILSTAGAALPACSQGEARVIAAQTVPGRWIIRTACDGISPLVVSEGYDAGWRCRIAGKEVPILKTNGLFMSVLVPAGENTVLLEYAPRQFRQGIALSGLGLLACILPLAGRKIYRRRRPAAAEEPVTEVPAKRPRPRSPAGPRKRSARRT